MLSKRLIALLVLGPEQLLGARDRQRRVWMIAGHHDRMDAGVATAGDGVGHTRPHGVFERQQAGELILG